MPFGATSIMRGEPLAPGTSPYLKSAADIRGNEEEENISMDEINEMERKAKEKTEYFGMVQPKDLDNS